MADPLGRPRRDRVRRVHSGRVPLSVAGSPALGFLALAVFLGRRWVGRLGLDGETARTLRALAGYSAAYYALWASADLVILVLGRDAGWALRVVPNQLYYGGWVVFAYAVFYRGAPAGEGKAAAQPASSTSTQADR